MKDKNYRDCWEWNGEERSAIVYFEVEGAGVDKEGNSCSAGATIKLEDCMVKPSDEEVEKQLKNIEEKGLMNLPAKAVTKEYFLKEFPHEIDDQ